MKKKDRLKDERDAARAEVERLTAERDEWKQRRDSAVETCRFLHQEGLTREEWHVKHCGAAQVASALRKENERLMVEGAGAGLNDLAQRINDNARDKGFWDGERNMGEMLMLAVSELSEALEEHRDGRGNVYVPEHREECPGSQGLRYAYERLAACDGKCKPEGVAVEIVDCIIRCLDMLHAMDIDVDHVVTMKMTYNATRPPMHGKAY